MEQPTKLCDENGEPVRSTPYPKGFAPTYHAYTMDYPEKRKTPARIFVSSMGDLFGEWVPDIWIEDVFAACKRAPQHTYLFLTKNPQRYLDMATPGASYGAELLVRDHDHQPRNGILWSFLRQHVLEH